MKNEEHWQYKLSRRDNSTGRSKEVCIKNVDIQETIQVGDQAREFTRHSWSRDLKKPNYYVTYATNLAMCSNSVEQLRRRAKGVVIKQKTKKVTIGAISIKS